MEAADKAAEALEALRPYMVAQGNLVAFFKSEVREQHCYEASYHGYSYCATNLALLFTR